MNRINQRRVSKAFVVSALLALLVLTLVGRGHVQAAVAGSNDSYSSSSTPKPENASPTTAFHNSIAARYNYAFGKEHPFLPSNATTVNGQFYDPKSFPTAQYCGHCHKESYHEWRQSAHSNSFRSPWYEYNVNLLIKEKGVQYSRHCEGCHNQPALFSGDLSQGMPKKRPFENEGVTCSVCHSIVSVNATGTGSYVMGVPAVLVDEKGEPITRPVSDAEILSHLDRHDAAVMRPFYRTSEFCSACHKAAVPRMLNDYKWLRAFTPYDEWQSSSFSKESPLPFYRKETVSNCQTCHMKRVAVSADSPDPGAKTDDSSGATTLANHNWPGANTLVPDYFKFPEQFEKTRAMLQNDAINVDIFGLEIEENGTDTNSSNAANAPKLIAPLGRIPVSLAAGQTMVADIVLQNKGIGHSYVPELRDFYESWVEFTVKDSAGKTIASSGFLKPDGSLDPDAHAFTNRIINNKGEFNDLHQVWDTHVLAYNNVLQSGRSQLVRYRFRLPKELTGAVTITATLRYRRFNQHFIDFAMGEQHFPEPIVDVAAQSRTFKMGTNAPVAADPKENPTWMRWNNYGIALLDAQQYQAAVDAFTEVAKLRPEYADAYTNIGIVDVLWEKYDDAKPNIAKALSILPGDPRALYYRAIVERNAGSVEDAVTDLNAVLAKYPRSRDALRELGFSYYQQHQYDKARECYEKLQLIDPDDLSAHYNLAILYRRLHDKTRSALEAGKFADQKDDPTASVYALEYLRKHPEIANESVVWHTHDLTGDKKKPEKIEYKYIPGAGM